MRARTLLLTAIILSTYFLIGSKGPSNIVLPSVRAAANTVSLALNANSLGWNVSAPQGRNPTITVARGDNVSITFTDNETGSEQGHLFVLDVDHDGPQCYNDYPSRPDYPDLCPPSSIINGAVTQFRFNSFVLPSGNYRYYCQYHPSSMVGDFIVLPKGPDFAITANATNFRIQPGQSSTLQITATSIRGFQGNVTLSTFTYGGLSSELQILPASKNITLTPDAGVSTNLKISATPNVSYSYTLVLTGTSGILARTIKLDMYQKNLSVNTPTEPILIDLIEGVAIAAAVIIPTLYYLRRRRLLNGQPKNQPTDLSTNTPRSIRLRPISRGLAT